MLKNGKLANCNEHQNRETDRSFLYKSRKTNLKNSKNHKTKNPNALLLEVWSFTL